VADTLSHSPKYQEEQFQPELTLLKFEEEKPRPTHYVRMIVAEYPKSLDIRRKYKDDKYFQKYQEEFV
jgi:hypothetical protein